LRPPVGWLGPAAMLCEPRAVSCEPKCCCFMVSYPRDATGFQPVCRVGADERPGIAGRPNYRRPSYLHTRKNRTLVL
jgi:hypothetical protein